MLFAEQILRRVGTALQVFGVVLGVTQIALGVQIILESLDMMDLSSEWKGRIPLLIRTGLLLAI